MYCRILFRAGFPLPGAAFSPGLLPEGVGEGVGVSGHGPGQGAVAGLDAEVAGEVVLVMPGGGADRGPLGRA